MLKHVLVPLDGSELSEVALEYARRVVMPDGKITLLSVVDLPATQSYFLYDMPITVVPDGFDTSDQARKIHDYTGDYLARKVGFLQEEGFTADYLVETGFPENAIVELAKLRHVDAIVMSTHGRSGISRLLFGSVTQRVLNAMPCPVMVIPPHARLTKQPSTAADTTA